ncbi:MAG: hypothetical protein ACKORY_07045 [Actinomycetota bacterium]
MAAWAMGERGSPVDGSVTALVEATLHHGEVLVREAAAAALGAIGDPRSPIAHAAISATNTSLSLSRPVRSTPGKSAASSAAVRRTSGSVSSRAGGRSDSARRPIRARARSALARR